MRRRDIIEKKQGGRRQIRTAFAQEVEITLIGLLALAFAGLFEFASLIASDCTADVQSAAVKNEVPCDRSRGVGGKEGW